jgi:hypothetical protein
VDEIYFVTLIAIDLHAGLDVLLVAVFQILDVSVEY